MVNRKISAFLVFLIIVGMSAAFSGCIEDREEGEEKTVIEWDGEMEKQSFYQAPGTATIRSYISFDEVGNRSLQIMDGDVELYNHPVKVNPRVGVENLEVHNLTVEPAEGENLEFAPAEVAIKAEVEHDGEVEEERTIELEISGESLGDSWVIESGERVDIEAYHTFEKDGLYTVALGEAFETIKIGVGYDVIVEGFEVEKIDPLNASIEAEIINGVKEKRTVRLRIEDEEEQIVDTEDWTLEPGERESISYLKTFDEEGTYYFYLGPEIKSITFEEEGEGEQTSSLSSQSSTESALESEEEDEFRLLQQKDIRVTSFSAPEEVTVGDGEFVKVEVENDRAEEQTLSLQMDEETLREVNVAPAGMIHGHTINFTYEMEADEFFEDLVIDVEGSAERYRHLFIEVKRPDGTSLELKDVHRGDRIGEINETIYAKRDRNLRENLYNQAREWLRRNTDKEEFPPILETDLLKILFGQQNEDWLHDPDILKGEYEIVVRLEGINIELQTGQVTLYE
ncbi:MAG: hypothetical protein ACOC87_04185 [Candidatus Natronoplasma sp.]